MDLPKDVVASLEPLAEDDPVRLLRVLEAAFQIRHEAPERGEAIARAAGAIAERRGHVHAQALAELVLVYCGPIAENVEAIVGRLRRACDVFQEVHDQQNLVRAADLLSTIYEGMGDYPSALHYAEEVVTHSRAIDDRLFEAYGLSSLAGILTATGELDAAERKVKLALTIAEALGSGRVESRLWLRLGRIARERGQVGEAQSAFERARALAKADAALFTEVDALTELGRTFEGYERWDEAETMYEEALSIADEDTRRIAGPSTMLGLGGLYLRTGRLEEAKTTLLGLQDLAQGFNMVPIQSEAAKALADVHEGLGQPEQALLELRRHIELREKMMEGESQRAVKRFQVKVEVAAARKDAEIYRLKYVELRAMQTQLVEAERMAAVGNLAAGLAHEMNTPIGVVRSNLDTMERALSRLSEELPDNVSTRLRRGMHALLAARETSRTALDRLEGLVRSLRRFIRLDEAQMQAFDLVEGLEATLDLLRPTVPEGIALERKLMDVPRIFGWPGLLNQAFLTLLANAVEALGEKGRVFVETRCEEEEVVVRIGDDGPGIPEDVLPRLFELEFQQNGARTRFRVGLATVQSIVSRHEGRIDVDTGPGRGTTFALRFPHGAHAVTRSDSRGWTAASVVSSPRAAVAPSA